MTSVLRPTRDPLQNFQIRNVLYKNLTLSKPVFLFLNGSSSEYNLQMVYEESISTVSN